MKDFVSTRTRIEKLGVKAGSDVLLLGIEKDTAFLNELETAGARVPDVRQHTGGHDLRGVRPPR